MYSKVICSKNLNASFFYCCGPSHSKKEKNRNLLITPINMTVSSKEKPGTTVAKMRKDFRGRRKKIECINIILSWSKEELNPNSEEDLEIANNIVKEFVKEHYSDGARKSICFFQRDGTNGCLHCHLLILNSDLHGKTVVPQNRFHPNVKSWIDEINQKYLKQNNHDCPKNRSSQTERAKEDKARKIREQNPNLSRDELQALLIEKKAYSYKADMKQRIRAAMESSKSVREFKRNLKVAGVSVERKSSQKYGHYLVYDFLGCPLPKKSSKKRQSSDYKLGTIYTLDAIKSYWRERDRVTNNTTSQKEDAFVNWMRAKGESYFVFSDSGKLIKTDFEKMERLHEEYELERRTHKDKQNETPSPTISDDKPSSIPDLTPIPNPAILQLHKTSSNGEDDDEEKQIQVTYQRYQQAKTELNFDYTSPQKTKDFSL